MTLKIIDVIDRLPPLPDELWRTICWFAKTWFIGRGWPRTLLPVPFLAGEPLERVCRDQRTGSSSVRYVYEPRDSDRMAVYRDILTASKHLFLHCFPNFRPQNFGICCPLLSKRRASFAGPF